jgi:hypothetical protein
MNADTSDAVLTLVININGRRRSQDNGRNTGWIMTAPSGGKGIVGVLGSSCNAEDDRLQLHRRRDLIKLLGAGA